MKGQTRYDDVTPSGEPLVMAFDRHVEPGFTIRFEDTAPSSPTYGGWCWLVFLGPATLEDIRAQRGQDFTPPPTHPYIYRVSMD